jgi:hypothetical protein
VFEMKFELGDPLVMTSGDLAVVVVEESLLQRGYDGATRTRVLACQRLRTRLGGAMVDGVASRVARAAPPLSRDP